MKRVVIIVAVSLVIAATIVGSLGWLRARRVADQEQRLNALRLRCDTFEEHPPCFAEWSSACDDGIGFACRRAAGDLHCGKETDRDLPRAVELYDRACGLGDDVSCSWLIDAMDDDRWSLPRPNQRLDRIRYLAAFKAAVRGDEATVKRLRAQLEDPGALAPEFDFLDASLEITAGHLDEARAIAKRLERDHPEEPALKVLLDLARAPSADAANDPITLVKAWTAEGAPLLSASRFLPEDTENFDAFACFKGLVEPSPVPSGDLDAFLEAAVRDRTPESDAALMPLAIGYSKQGDFNTRWIAATILARASNDPNHGESARAALVPAVERLAREAPEDLMFSMWSMSLREPPELSEAVPEGARYGARRVALAEWVLQHLSKKGKANPFTAFGLMVEAGAAPELIGFAKRVAERAGSNNEAEKRETANRLMQVGTLLTSGTWFVDRATGARLQISAADLADDAEFRAIAEATRAKFRTAYQSRIDARLGTWPLAKLNGEFIVRAVEDETGFQQKLNALAAP